LNSGTVNLIGIDRACCGYKCLEGLQTVKSGGRIHLERKPFIRSGSESLFHKTIFFLSAGQCVVNSRDAELVNFGGYGSKEVMVFGSDSSDLILLIPCSSM